MSKTCVRCNHVTCLVVDSIDPSESKKAQIASRAELVRLIETRGNHYSGLTINEITGAVSELRMTNSCSDEEE